MSPINCLIAISTIGITLLGFNLSVKAADLNFASGWEMDGDGKILNPNQVNLSTDGLADDDFDLGAANGDFNVSGNPAALVGLGNLESFLNINASQLDLGGTAYEGSAIKTKTSLVVNQLSELSFDWEFLTNETANVLVPNRGPFKDYGFFLIGQSVNPLANFQNTNQGNCPLGFDSCTGVQKNTYFLSPGTYSLAFGVIDIDDVTITSALRVSNITLKPFSEGSNPTGVPEANLVIPILAFGGLGVRLLGK